MPPQNRTPTDLNYAVLSRYLPRLHQILTTASYAHIYLWSSSSQTWSKANFEGSVFIVSLTPPTPSQPEDYLLFLLNRSGLDNFSYALREPGYIDSDSGDIIMLRANDTDAATADSELVYGLFVSCEENTSTADDRKKLLRVMKECAATFQTASAAVPTSGRQISLTELFQGQSDRRDMQHPIPTAQGYMQTGWEGTPAQQLPQQQMYHGQPPVGGGGDMLMNLFQRANEARLKGGTPTQSHGY